MHSVHTFEMPADFPNRVHQALRNWHKQEPAGDWGNLLLLDQIQTQEETASFRLVSNQILMHGLDDLKASDSEAVDLLERRFLNAETAREIAYSFNVTDDVIYQRQRTAIENLARVIWKREVELRTQQAQRIEARLDVPTYTRLFGITENLTLLQEKIQSSVEPWIIAIEGMGGVGKTALADALVRQMAAGIHIRDIAWITVRQRLFRLTGEVKTLTERPSLTPEGLLDQLIEQFGLESLQRQQDAEKLPGVKHYLQERRSLIVIDNLETIADYHALLPRLRVLTQPSKCLITTRYSLQGESGVYIFPLQPLSQEDTLALIRYEAQTQGLHDLAQASDDVLTKIYHVTGGNPLATKLVIGKLHAFSLPVVLERLTEAHGKPTQDLLNFLYADAWEMLPPPSRRLMQALLLMPEAGGTLDQLAEATGIQALDAADGLRLLAQYSLVDIKGNFNERRYALHQLTRTFVERIVTQA